MPGLVWHWGPPIVMMAALFVSSSGNVGPDVPGRFDLVVHVSAYFLLGLLVIRGFARARWDNVTRAALVAGWLVTVAYGASDELHQTFVAGRTAAFDDWGADALGAAMAVAVAAFAARAALSRRTRGRAV